jgi:heme A synthase
MMWLSFASLSSVYAVMLIGVYITASHQGLSCPEWPLCPSGFKFPAGKYFFEVLHRLLAVITTAIILATAGYAAKRMHAIRKTAIASSIIVSAQVVLGMFVVNTELEPLIVATHLSSGVLLFAMTLMTFLFAYRIIKNPTQY